MNLPYYARIWQKQFWSIIQCNDFTAWQRFSIGLQIEAFVYLQRLTRSRPFFCPLKITQKNLALRLKGSFHFSRSESLLDKLQRGLSLYEWNSRARMIRVLMTSLILDDVTDSWSAPSEIIRVLKKFCRNEDVTTIFQKCKVRNLGG